MSERRDDLARVALLVVAAGAHFVWLASVVANQGTQELARRDWSAFRAAGRAVIEGRALYEAQPGGFPFLHPPAVAVLAAPLSGVGDLDFYVVTLGLGVAGLFGAAWALRRITSERVDTWALVALASAPWLIAITLGQPTALLVLSWLLGYALLERRPLAAGLVFSACALKPPLLIPLIAYVVARRRWRALSGLALGGAVIFAIGLALGADVYVEWVAAMVREQPAASLSWKQHTLLALLRSGLPEIVAWAAWGVLGVALGGLILRRVARGPRGLRAFGMLALATVALSPYAYFYDALLLLVPLAALLHEADRYPVARRRVLLVCAALTGLTQYAVFFFVQAGPALAAIPLTVWLALELATPPALAHHRVRELDRQPEREAP